MAQTLQLEYACTKAETDQAQTLAVRKQLGGGSKWRTWLVLFLILAGMLLALYFQVVRDLPRPYRPYVIPAVFALATVIVLWKRRSHSSPPKPTRVEISNTDFTILGSDSKVAMPWSGFSDCLESPELFVLMDRARTTLIVIPKRVFPDESWQNWFRVQAERRSSPAEPPSTQPPAIAPSASKHAVTFRVQVGYRDYLDRTTASWRTWGIFIGLAVIIAAVNLYAAAHPPPDAVNSAAKVFFVFEVPFFLLMGVIMIPVISFMTWRAHKKTNPTQEIALSEESMAFASTDASGTLPWTSYTYYKETRWSFILWKKGTQIWTMFPKRAFQSPDDVSRARVLLARHLKQSRWFLG